MGKPLMGTEISPSWELKLAPLHLEITMETYEIVRFYAPHLNKESEVMQRGLSLEEAQEHCQDESTQQKGVYFDGYRKE